MRERKKDVDQAIAKRLREARLLAGFESAAEAAKKLGIKYQTYVGYENGNSGFSFVKTRKFAQFFKGKFIWLARGAGRSKRASLEDELGTLDSAHQQQILNMIELFRAEHRRRARAHQVVKNVTKCLA
jgi:transcriptional regulator with XRE-family HTH domain